MEKAIIKTLIYADIFDYPLTIREIHKWLIGKVTEPRKVEKTLKKLYQVVFQTGSARTRIKYQGEYNFLSGRQKVVRIRHMRQKQSYIYIRKVTILSWFLKVVSWIKLVGISGGLAMENAGKYDDIDLFVITAKNRLWLSRIFILGLLGLLGQRRKRTDSKRQAAGKICCNIILEEEQLKQINKDLYTAHEVLQMKVLWQKDGMYQKFLEDNSWAFRYLPNWIGDRIKNQEFRIKPKKHNSLFFLLYSMVNVFEGLAKSLQLNHMGKPKGMERISNGALYFHPEDCREWINSEYQKKLRRAGLI